MQLDDVVHEVRGGAPQGDLHHFGRLTRQLVERAVPVHSGAEVDLGEVLVAHEADEIDEQTHLDAISLHERHALEDVAAAGILARQGLHEAGELGMQQGDERSSDQLGDPATWPSPTGRS